MSVIAARELDRYGVTVNAIYPTAMSRLTEDILGGGRRPDLSAGAAPGFDPLDPGNVAPLVAWLGSVESSDITGRVFGVRGSRITVAEGWHAGPRIEKEGRWHASELGNGIPELVRQAAANAETSGEIPATRHKSLEAADDRHGRASMNRVPKYLGDHAELTPEKPAAINGTNWRHPDLPRARRTLQSLRAMSVCVRPAPWRPYRDGARKQHAVLRAVLGRIAFGADDHAGQPLPDRFGGGLHHRGQPCAGGGAVRMQCANLRPN